MEDNRGCFLVFVGLILGFGFVVYLIYSGFATMYARDGELIGHAKKITLVTPFWSSICPAYYALDVSMVQNGTGSMFTQDVWFTVLDLQDLELMRRAVAEGAIVKVKYDKRRFYACTEEHYVTGFQCRYIDACTEGWR